MSKKQTSQEMKKIHILTYPKIRGETSGPLSQAAWSSEGQTFSTHTQIAQEINKDGYKVAKVDPKTGNIVGWFDVGLMEVRSKIEGQEGTGLTTQTTWNLQSKKKLVQEFGTSKSKRKVNQMLNNTINI